MGEKLYTKCGAFDNDLEFIFHSNIGRDKESKMDNQELVSDIQRLLLTSPTEVQK